MKDSNKGKDISGKGKSMCNGPEEGRYLAYSENIKETAEWSMVREERVTEDEFGDAGHAGVS